MKKITLAAIVIFTIAQGTIFLGSTFAQQELSPDGQKQTYNGIAAKNANLGNDQNLNKNGTVPNNEVNHLNSPEININNLKFNSKSSGPDSFTLNEVSKHNSQSDCYLVINNKVYDVSSYISYHPGGSRIIISYCGQEVTGIFARIHSNWAWDLLKNYKIGTVTTSKIDTTSQILTAISDALKKANPGAEVIRVRPKKDFYIAKIIYQGKLYEIHINSRGKIFKEEIEDDEYNWSLWQNDADDG